MAYIYKITNKINGKIYIGKTNQNPDIRLKEHINNSKRNDSIAKRPLYLAFNKYGIENFSLVVIEECSLLEANNKEKFWINYYQSYYNGYNATFGGDGNNTANYLLIHSLFKQGKTNKEISELTGYCSNTITKALTVMGIKKDELKERHYNNKPSNGITKAQPVVMIDKISNKELKVFSSINEAAIFLGLKGHHIGDVCKGKRKTAHGYKWRYLNLY